MRSVPAFFQDESEEGRRCQVEWLELHLGLRDSFFARFLDEEEAVFVAWRKSSAPLGAAKANFLSDCWHTVLRLLSFQNFDEAKVRSLLEKKASEPLLTTPSAFSPPWSASSLKEYLETHGPAALAEADRWVESFRFGDPYAPHQKEVPCR